MLTGAELRKSYRDVVLRGDIMGKDKKCLRCGGKNLTPANFESTGKIYSRPKDAKLVTVLTTGVMVDAMICLDCGHIDLAVNVEKARAISKPVCMPE